MASNSKEEVDFCKELDDFELQLPGRGTESVPFSDNQTLLGMLDKMYPDWEEEGKVTSVPVARVPQLFLHNLALCKELERKLKATQKGELAEGKLYRLFITGKFADQPGFVIFPNFDGSHLFHTQIAKVEIDMLLVHQRKGVFIFNMKNVGGSTLFPEKVRKDIHKHWRFVKMLMDYKSDQNLEHGEVPIHSIVCNFQTDCENFERLEDETDNATNCTLVFNRIHLDPDNFSETWINKINDEIKSSVKSNSALKILVARLVALSSIESSAALIHKNMQSGFLQSMKKPEHLKTQISAVKKDGKFSKDVIELSKTQNQKAKQRYILWTKEQMDIIARIYDELVNTSSNNGMRVLVEGCKGSGKTMLLAFIAKLAQRIFVERKENVYGRIFVFVAEEKDTTVIKQLQAVFNREEFSEIVIHENPYSENHPDISTHELDKEQGRSFLEKFGAAKLILCDEYSSKANVLLPLKDDQHVILFSSTKLSRDSLPKISPNSNYISFTLSFSLRSTLAITNFADEWIKRGGGRGLSKVMFSCRPAHNYEGERNDIVFVKNDDFVSSSVGLISQYYERLSGFQVLPVICFMSTETRNEIFSAIPRATIYCDAEEPGVVEPQQGKPLVKFFKPLEVQGSEFGSVIILINFKHVKEIGRYLDQWFLSSISRATTKTAIIINQDQLSECCESENQTGSCCAFDAYGKYVDDIRREGDSKPSYLLIGAKEPMVTGFVQSDQLKPIPEVPRIILYVAREGSGSFLYCQDVYKESHLDKLYEEGVRQIVILKEDDDFTVGFYEHTKEMIELYSKNRKQKFIVSPTDASNELAADTLHSVLEYCQKHPALSILREKWPKRESTYCEMKYFSWRQWKEKAGEAYRVHRNFLALNLYGTSLRILYAEYSALIQNERLSQAAENKIEQAKVLREIVWILSIATKVVVDLEEAVFRRISLFNFQDVYPYEFLFSLIKPIQFSLDAIQINACFDEIHELLSKAIEELKQFFEHEQNKMTIRQREGSCDVAIRELINKEKKNKNIVDLWGRESDHQDAFTIEIWINDYERIQHSKEESELIHTRKTISYLLRQSSEDTFDYEPIVIASDKKVEVNDIVQNVVNTVKLFSNPLRFAVEAWKWDPMEPECYHLVFSVLKVLEENVVLLRKSVCNVDSTEYVKRLVSCEILTKSSSHNN